MGESPKLAPSAYAARPLCAAIAIMMRCELFTVFWAPKAAPSSTECRDNASDRRTAVRMDTLGAFGLAAVPLSISKWWKFWLPSDGAFDLSNIVLSGATGKAATVSKQFGESDSWINSSSVV